MSFYLCLYFLCMLAIQILLANGQLPDNYYSLPLEIRQQYMEIQQAKLKHSLEIKKQILKWNSSGPDNYMYTVQRYQEPTPPSPYTEPVTIMVCGSNSNETDLYENLNTIPKIFSAAQESIDSLGELYGTFEIVYDSTYHFPIEYLRSQTNVFYTVEDGEIVGISMTGPLEQGLAVTDFVVLSEDACVVS
eukprot:TRINITY_DN2604_c0_g1_i10.p2 TRINITY_DN2604_c0_g1~~TRINITY_DN2604_c0_g1_i10.p2  ORF type:complete len:190 (-),score=21.31 TRINITY_DN2604_c0_g1_i10:578-1147(-)